MTGAMPTVCPACGTPEVQDFYDVDGLPVHSCLLLHDRDEAARFPTGRLRLGHCARCGFVTNTAFDASLHQYGSRYEETQGFSPRFTAFAEELAARWVDRYGLTGRTVLEIGCGKGEFLVKMIEAGAGGGIGIDPSWLPDRLTSPAAAKVRWIPELYTEAHGELDADAIVCRHTLEHIHPVGDFMRLVRRSVRRPDVPILFELPDVERVLREGAFWDVYYEHCSYFTTASLERLFRATGFEVLDVSRDFDDQYLLIEAMPGDPDPTFDHTGFDTEITELVGRFAQRQRDEVARWRDRLTAVRDRGGTSVLWGAGSKAVAYLVALGADAPVASATDINPHKWHTYLAGTAVAVVPPKELAELQPELVVAMNPIYLDEIRAELDELGVRAELEAV